MPREIRRLSIDDYDRIISVWLDAGLPFKPKGRDSKEMIQKEMAHECVAYFGLFENGQLIAVSIANYDGRRGWINRLAVHPDYRGQNIARELIAECERFMRSKGAVVLTALIEDINEPSISTFKKAGFVCESSWLYFAKRDSKES
jgi:ribosomal protein S18 acetylase RimI-like enzyme